MTLALFAVGKSARIVHGDAAIMLRRLADSSIDALVTDPPSAIGFMGNAWDGDRGGRDRWVAWLAGILAEARRAMKPGAHGLVWALPRTSHWTGLALEDAGFEVRDRITHLFGEGMPKSHHVLKPAAEDWWLVRRPCEGTTKATIAKYGTGGLNIEACRIPNPDGGGSRDGEKSATRRYGRGGDHGFAVRPGPRGGDERGRWPSHVVLDDGAAAMLDAQSGARPSGGYPPGGAVRKAKHCYGAPSIKGDALFGASSGGASRFFYVAKADESDKTDSGAVENAHQTVKSTSLMRWLVRLVTPPGGIVLDPFAGSGTTGVACAAEGMSFLGIEGSEKHATTARRRLERCFGEVGASL